MIPRGTPNPPLRRVVDLSLQLKSTLDNLLCDGQLQGYMSIGMLFEVQLADVSFGLIPQVSFYEV